MDKTSINESAPFNLLSPILTYNPQVTKLYQNKQPLERFFTTSETKYKGIAIKKETKDVITTHIKHRGEVTTALKVTL